MYDERQIALLVGWCSPSARAVLARGPIIGVGCRVCDALDEMRDWSSEFCAEHPHLKDTDVRDLRNISRAQKRRLMAMIELHEWHEGGDLVESHGVIPGYGPEVYARCLQIYTAAGWQGRAD